MTISKENYRENSLHERTQLYNLIQSGHTAKRAMNMLWPLKDKFGRRQNTSRLDKLENWKRYSLWPPSDEELSEAQAMGILKPPDAKQQSKALEQFKERVRIALCVTGTERVDNQQSIATTHLGCRVPIKYVKKLESLGGSKTRHIIKAIQIYLAVLKQEKEKSPGVE